MPRKTDAERALIDAKIAVSRAGTRAHRTRLVVAALPKLDEEQVVQLLDAFGHAEWKRGVDEGVRDATED